MTDNDGAIHHDDDDQRKPFRDWSWSSDDQNLALGLGVLLLFLLGTLGLSQCGAVTDAVDDLGITSSEDDDLLERTEDALEDDEFVIGTDDNNVDVGEKGGVITLTGVVATQALKDQAGETAADVDGVTRVANNLTIAAPATTEAPAPTTAAPPATTEAPPATTEAPAPTTEAPAVIEPVSFDGTYADGEITIAGEVPDEITRSAVIDGFGQQYAPAGITVVDALTINENTTLEDGVLNLVGEVPDQATRGTIVTNAEAVAGTVNMTVNDGLTVIATDESLLAELNELFAVNGSVLFATSSAELTGEATAVLDQAIDILNQDPNLNVTIEGHTDSDGSDASNLALSDARANSVLSYFTSNGIGSERLTAIGKGEAEPVADNATPEGKQQNRRINFVGTES